MDKISVVIPTYNRFNYVLNTIKSIKEQTYKNVEIIVVNDKSTQEEYYSHDWKKEDVTILHLEKNSKKNFGYACAGHVRNKGIEISTGNYVAFCDDDDIWLPNKLELQLKAMQESGCAMCCTEGYYGNGVYNPSIEYKKYNSEHYYNTLKRIYGKRKTNFLKDGFPDIWTNAFLQVHNCVICSSVLMKKELLDTIKNMKCVKNGKEDYDCWLRATEHTNVVYVKEPCFFYDGGHGDGQNY